MLPIIKYLVLVNTMSLVVVISQKRLMQTVTVVEPKHLLLESNVLFFVHWEDLNVQSLTWCTVGDRKPSDQKQASWPWIDIFLSCQNRVFQRNYTNYNLDVTIFIISFSTTVLRSSPPMVGSSPQWAVYLETASSPRLKKLAFTRLLQASNKQMASAGNLPLKKEVLMLPHIFELVLSVRLTARFFLTGNGHFIPVAVSISNAKTLHLPFHTVSHLHQSSVQLLLHSSDSCNQKDKEELKKV